ncbi:glycogen/starch/alpha-glucan phosphorylase [Candidatus Sumerlaeota bacterium]|nr:glycogen/starch/alpha-glucan phosphorylase [Candidatus Sumerlaeota bacterium]
MNNDLNAIKHSIGAGAAEEQSLTGTGKITQERFLALLRYHLRYTLGHQWGHISDEDTLRAVSLTVRDLMVDRMLETELRYTNAKAKRVYYLSMEFLVGRSLGNNLTNLDCLEVAESVMQQLGYDIDNLRDLEIDAALGNGGLGRLAACFLESLATLDMPGFGYGINYEYGIFRQEIDPVNGQVERPDNWRTQGTPWLVEHPDEFVTVPTHGRLEIATDRNGESKVEWLDCKYIRGIPADMPIIGYGGHTCNWLRLYSATSTHEFDLIQFNEGAYFNAISDKLSSENISKVLYPSDAVDAGRELRLLQEYFFVSCAIRDIMRRTIKNDIKVTHLHEYVAIQLNDTHPALAVAELMRVLIVEHHCTIDKAWKVTTNVMGYTNHTLLPEALETWSESLLKRVLPFHLYIIQQINQRFLDTVRKFYPNDEQRIRAISIIEDVYGQKMVRMAHLAIVGSHAVNGVAELHSQLVQTNLVPQFYEMTPEKFSNITNGVTPRRWLLKANPGLAELITKTIGNGWITNLYKLRDLEPYALDEQWVEDFMNIKRNNKTRFAKYVHDTKDIVIDPDSMFDCIAKRIHEYKRQLLMIMRVIHEYLSIIEDDKIPDVKRTYIFSGKAAPGYWAAKQIVRLANDLQNLIKDNPKVSAYMQVLFMRDYRVSLAERIMPATDLSEQISTAGKEASGTGNMKFAMNGALTMCTYDGANVEMLAEIGNENIFVFGHSDAEIHTLKTTGQYRPWDIYHANPDLRRVLDVFNNAEKLFPEDPGRYRWVWQSMLNQGDPYFHVGDFQLYLDAQNKADKLFLNKKEWGRKAVLNVARMGKFSSDRAIEEYARDIWNIQPIP